MDGYIQSVTLFIVILGALALEKDATNKKKDAENDTASGHWGPWTEWSRCGQACGYGTQYRIRQCHGQTQDNASCSGLPKQFKICHQRPCPPDHQDHRSIECAKHNHVFYGTRRYRWVPYINDQAPCELSCKSVGYGYYARFKTTVEDGVICNEENTATCINGQCLKSGCDGILESGSREDICGVCGGRGDTCRIISGIYTRTHLTYRGYNIVAVIPAGARGINVTEIGRSKNHLALSTPQGYFLNGHLRLQALGPVRGAGTVFTYRRGWRDGCRGECLAADGPLNTSVRVELIYFGRNPGIKYSYAIPNHDPGEGRDPGFRVSPDQQDADAFTLSSKIQVKVRPTYVRDGRTNSGSQQLRQGQDRQDRYLQDAEATTRDPYKIIRQKDTNVIPRQKDRNAYSRSDNMTRQKGSPKHRRRRIKMTPTKKIINNYRVRPSTKEDQPRNKTVVQYRHYYHTNALDGLGDVPVKAEVRPRTVYSSSYKPDRKLSKDDARQYLRPRNKGRERSSYIDNNIPLPPTLDDDDSNNNNNNKSSNTDNDRVGYHRNNYSSRDRQSQRRRGAQQDGVFSWRISGFTDCTQPCGGGLQETRVVCIKADSQVEVIEEDCDVIAKPKTTTVVCNNQPCKPDWSISQWSPCSVSCGRGLRKRDVACQQRISPTLTIPDNIRNCPSPRPQSRQYCQLDPCYRWKPSNWSKCSTVCGFGQRSRTLTCIDTQGQEVKSHVCTGLVKPTTEEICDMGSCAQGWFHSKWTKQCSAECGRGHYVRQVYCSAPDGSPLDENKCGGMDKKPRNTKSCKAPQPCGGQWFAGPWSKCNDTCGSNAVRQREVLCIKQHGKRVRGITKNHNCDDSKKPVDTEPCPSLPVCRPQWYMMGWSNCSKPCDTGVRTREVTCLDVDFKQSPDCDKKTKPSLRQSCNPFPCQQNYKEFSASSKGGKTQILQQDGTIIDVPACEDKNGAKWCRLVSQSRLCSYYKELCCRTCRHRHRKSKG